uniref:MAM domain-containing protein n=1 Tax=Syphacia muris TaxID=451379 RepID=A0A0N5AKV8_9BILA
MAVDHRIALLLKSLVLIAFSDSCAPPPSIGTSSPLEVNTRNRAFGGNTEKANIISLELKNTLINTILISVNVISAPIKGTSDLLCYEFDDNCHWHNMGYGIDRLNWYQGAGTLDSSRLQISTGTNIAPEGTYAIVATDTVKPADTEAILVSDVIHCQLGAAELRFMYDISVHNKYWSSPKVQITVCVKKTTKLYPDFDFCHPPIEGGDPGPVILNIDDVDQKPFQIFIRATNFVFQAPNLEGGFAILDNIEYFGDLCADSFQHPTQKENKIFEPSISVQKVSSNNFPVLSQSQQSIGIYDSENANIYKNEHLYKDLEKTQPINTNPNVGGRIQHIPYELDQFIQHSHSSFVPQITTAPFFSSLSEARHRKAFAKAYSSNKLPRFTSFGNRVASARQLQSMLAKTTTPVKTSLNLKSLCDTLNCNFSASPCNNYVRDSEWSIALQPVGNARNGIPGDASILPYNPDGAFVFISGPVDRTRLIMPSFTANAKFYLVFWYYKTSQNSKLRVIAKRTNEEAEHTLYMAPENNRNWRIWFQESRVISAGSYDYIAFEAGDLDKDEYIAIDEITIWDGKKRSVCNNGNEFIRH